MEPSLDPDIELYPPETFKIEHKTYDRVSFELSTFIGMATLPVDRSISSKTLLENASQALQYARANRLTSAVLFSEMKH